MITLNLISILPLTMLGVFQSKTKDQMQRVSIIGSIIQQSIILLMYENQDNTISRYQFQIYQYFGIDSLSLTLIWLVGILQPIIILNISYKKINKFKLISLISISWISIIIFLSLDIQIFYISYEILLIPMYYLIGYYGSRNRKIGAQYEFYMYTQIGSLLLLLVILFLLYENGHTSFELLSLHQIPSIKQFTFFFFLLIGFGIKIPMIPLHIWLPKLALGILKLEK